MSEPWERLRPVLRDAFGELDAAATVVDVGAGTGMGTRVLAAECAAQIVALEPNITMRTALAALTSGDVELTRRLTILADPAPDGLDQVDALVGGPIDGFVCGHMLGHLDTRARSATLAALATRLRPDGTGVLTYTAASAEPDRTGGAAVERRAVGRHVYEARYLDTGPDTYEVTYLVLHGDEVQRWKSHHGRWRPLTAEQLRPELTAAGLVLTESSATVGVVRRRIVPS